MTESVHRFVRLSCIIIFACLQPVVAGHAVDDYERPPTLAASEILPAELLKGEYHQVAGDVGSDGYLNQYTIASDYGGFQANGTFMLRMRVKEIGALAELERISRTEVFLEAAVDAGLDPARAVLKFVKNPIRAVIGIPAGIGRLFARTSHRAEEGYESFEESVSGRDEAAATCQDIEDQSEREECEKQLSRRQRGRALHERYFNLSDAERRWHQKLGTDPYTSNDVLYEAVKKVAWADRLGRFSIKFVSVPSAPAIDYISKVNELVWSKDPYELQNHNMAVLRDAGAEEETIEAFFNNPWLSPSIQTTLIAGLEKLQGIPGRNHILRQAIDTANEAEARFVEQSLVGLAWFHHARSPLVKLLSEPSFPVAVTDDGRIIVLLPVDYLIWSEEIAVFARELVDRYGEQLEVGCEMWIFRDVSDRARSELSKLGWIVKDNRIGVITDTIRNEITGHDDNRKNGGESRTK